MLTVEEAAELADCHPQTVYDWIEKGKFPVETEEITRIPDDAFDRWLEARETYRRGISSEKASYPPASDLKDIQLSEEGEIEGWGTCTEVLHVVKPVARSTMADGFAALEETSLEVARAVFSPSTLGDLRKWNSQIDWGRRRCEDGRIVGSLWNADLVVSPKIPSHAVFFFSPKAMSERGWACISVSR